MHVCVCGFQNDFAKTKSTLPQALHFYFKILRYCYNFRIFKYIHLKTHFFGNINYDIKITMVVFLCAFKNNQNPIPLSILILNISRTGSFRKEKTELQTWLLCQSFHWTFDGKSSVICICRCCFMLGIL